MAETWTSPEVAADTSAWPEMKQEHSGPTGWTTEAIWPIMGVPYHMGCCDCNLVHDIEFGVLKRARGRDFGGFRPARCGSSAGPLIYTKRQQAALGPRAVQVTMRVRRNEIMTARERARKAAA